MFESYYRELTDAERKIAVSIVLENAKWAKQRGLSFMAEERERYAKQVERGGDGGKVSIELYRAVAARLPA